MLGEEGGGRLGGICKIIGDANIYLILFKKLARVLLLRPNYCLLAISLFNNGHTCRLIGTHVATSVQRSAQCPARGHQLMEVTGDLCRNLYMQTQRLFAHSHTDTGSPGAPEMSSFPVGSHCRQFTGF